eukprot:332550-Rhodomonas_salina.2
MHEKACDKRPGAQKKPAPSLATQASKQTPSALFPGESSVRQAPPANQASAKKNAAPPAAAGPKASPPAPGQSTSMQWAVTVCSCAGSEVGCKVGSEESRGRSASGVVAGTKEGYMLVLKRGMVLPGLEQQVFYCHHMCGFKGNFEQTYVGPSTLLHRARLPGADAGVWYQVDWHEKSCTTTEIADV